MHFDIWFPVVTLFLGAALVLAIREIEGRWKQFDRRHAQREQFEFERLTELLNASARWHAIADRHYWACLSEYDISRQWPTGRKQEPIDATDRAEYSRLWTEMQVLSLLISDRELQDEIDELRDAAAQTIESISKNAGTVAYQRETEAYLAVAKHIGKLLSADFAP